MGRVVLTIFAGGWGLFGVACLVAPSMMLQGFGIELSEPDAVAEIRAMYGGANLGLAAFFAYASRNEVLFKPALGLAALIMGGFAVARIGGILLDGATGPLTIGSVAFEILVVCVAVVALRRQGSSALGSAT